MSKSPFKSKAFRELQAKWYAKLESKGFNDIENADGSLKEPNIRTLAFSSPSATQNYFDALLHRVNADPKITDKQHKALTLYCQGIRIEGIEGICEQTGYTPDGFTSLLRRYTRS